MSQEFKRSNKPRNNGPTQSSLKLIQYIQVAARRSSTDMTTVFHSWWYDIFIKINSNLKRKKLHRIDQGSNLLWSSFSSKVRSSQFHNNRTSYLTGEMKQGYIFSSLETNKPLPTLLESHSGNAFFLRGMITPESSKMWKGFEVVHKNEWFGKKIEIQWKKNDCLIFF